MTTILRTLLAAVLALGALAGAAPAQADGPVKITTLPRVIVDGYCPAGVPFRIWADFQRRSDDGRRRVVRAGFSKTDARYLVRTLDVYAYPGGQHGGTVFDPATTAGSLYVTGSWATRSQVEAYVYTTPYGGGEPCGGTLGSN